MSGRLKNHTLKGGTSPYSLCMGVHPPSAGTKGRLTCRERADISKRLRYQEMKSRKLSLKLKLIQSVRDFSVK